MSRYSARNEKEKTKSAEIGNRLLELRKNYGKSVGKSISQGDFGAVLGIGGDTQASRDTLIGRLERGECDIKPSELQRYSEVCGVSIDYIVNGGEYKHEVPPTEYTIRDFCNAIVLLDKCGLLHILNLDDKFMISFEEREFVDTMDDLYFDRLDGEFACWETDGVFDNSADLPPFCDLRKFINSYGAIKRIMQVKDIPDRKSIADLALAKSIENVTPFPINTLLEIAEDNLKKDTGGPFFPRFTNMNLPEENSFMNLPEDFPFS